MKFVLLTTPQTPAPERGQQVPPDFQDGQRRRQIGQPDLSRPRIPRGSRFKL